MRVSKPKNNLQLLFHSENSSIPIVEFQYEDGKAPRYFGDEYQRELAEDAIRYKYINLGSLVYILAADEQYTEDIIQHLWEKYKKPREYIVKDAKGKTKKIPKERPKTLYSFWHDFIFRLALREIKGIPQFNGLMDVPLLPLTFLDMTTEGPVKFDRKKNPTGDGALVLLEDLKKYFTDILEIPLPALIFPNVRDSTLENKGLNKKLRPNQIHKKKCRSAAEKLWNIDRSITIADMITHQKILNVSKKSNGDYYLEKTIRAWIKDLCPNRSPGRRPAKK